MKKLLAILAAGACLLAAQAETLTPEQALRRAAGAQARALRGFPSARGMKLSRKVISPSTKEPVMYVFKGQGSMIVAGADDNVQPVLGYISGDVSGKMPPEMEWWLKQYAKQIAYMEAHPKKFPNRGQERNIRGDMTPIAPLMTSQWNQMAPYYDFAPVENGTHCFTGCAATAASQVMYYFKYPSTTLHGTLSCNWRGTTLTLPIDGKRFDWNNMKPVYTSGQYTAAEGNAVAFLMQAVGYAAKMNYSTSGSGAYTTDMLTALKFFGYSDKAQYVRRGSTLTADWEKIIYDNLRDYGPVYYAGFSSDYSGGHAFVCDGYQGQGFFHFNWGWGGAYDGYFRLDALVPSGVGAGGNAGNYSYMQEVILYLAPPPTPTPTGKSPISINGNLKAERPDARGLVAFTSDATGGKMCVENVSGAEGAFVFAMEVTRKGGGGSPVYGPASSRVTLKPGVGIRRLMLKLPANLADGTYVVRPVVSKAGEHSWQTLNHSEGAIASYSIVIKNGKAISVK